MKKLTWDEVTKRIDSSCDSKEIRRLNKMRDKIEQEHQEDERGIRKWRK